MAASTKPGGIRFRVHVYTQMAPPVVLAGSETDQAYVIGVTANQIINRLLDDDGEDELTEASIRRPPRSKIWVATITSAVPGEQICRSTGIPDGAEALAIARKWEAEERKRRMELARQNRRPKSPKAEPGGLTQEEVTAFLKMSTRAVRNTEKRALAKLSRHPALRSLWAEYTGHVAEDSEVVTLTQEEMSALLGLARTQFELDTLRKLIGDIPFR